MFLVEVPGMKLQAYQADLMGVGKGRVEGEDQIPPAYRAPCPVNCPCHRRQGIRVIIVYPAPPELESSSS